MTVLSIIRDYVDALVHPSAQDDALTPARHRAFIAPRLIGSVVGACGVSALSRVARRAEHARDRGVCLAGCADPLGLLPLRTGRYEGAHILSVAGADRPRHDVAQTGGISSFAAIWLVLVPLEAALSASRRVVALRFRARALRRSAVRSALSPCCRRAVERSLAALMRARLRLGGALRHRPRAQRRIARAHQLLACSIAEEDRYRLLARNMTDVITRHGRNGAVLFVSPAAEALFGTPGARLLGHGLFDRVHVADRPAYLTALADAARGSEQQRRIPRAPRRRDQDIPRRFLWVEMRCRPLDHGEGETAEVVAVMRDVTERKAQEEALEPARADADAPTPPRSVSLPP